LQRADNVNPRDENAQARDETSGSRNVDHSTMLSAIAVCETPLRLGRPRRRQGIDPDAGAGATASGTTAPPASSGRRDQSRRG